MYVAWEHNPQYEFHDYLGNVDWSHWLLIGASWAIAVFLAATPACLFVAYLFGLLVDRKR